ncbi:hypothetical protein DW905_12385 [Faecalibacterium prausnitzii]|uniref:Uncharacterized protein n=1 Tax=Faecalibacterium prausnitzii TaxID=853 RepID=A0A3E2V139_9FIRM|nr:hypothetical protein DW905_12385 [Faecalibacterium prausnitzii]
MFSIEIQVIALMRKLSLIQIQRRRKTIQKLVSVFGRMLDKGEKRAFWENKFGKKSFLCRQMDV